MICECKKLKTGSFKTEDSYLSFQKNVNQLAESSVLKKVGEVDGNSPFITYEYFCLVCGATWLLKVPDQAYRGGWFEKQ